MAALEALPFLRADERPSMPAWLPELREWRWDGDEARYRALQTAFATFELLPGAVRVRQDLRLPLITGPFRFVLHGRVEHEFYSSEPNEAQRHLRAAFQLPGDWCLHWHLCTARHALSGAVRLESQTWLGPGEGKGFRHVIAARALRRALTRAFSPPEAV